jgi:hypothetical protein
VLRELLSDELLQLRNGFAAMHPASQKLIQQEAAKREQATRRPGKVKPA